MSDADAAYAAAREAIGRARRDGAETLSLGADAFRALETLPPEIAELAALKALDLSKSQVTDLDPLQALTSLKSLNLDVTRVSALTPLETLTSLQTLGLCFTQVADLAPLEALTSLQALGLILTQVTDLTPLQALTNLQTLTLDGTRVDDLGPLEALTSLQTLTIDGTRVADLAPLQALTSLQVLRLDGTPVANLAPLQALTSLRVLGLNETRVADLAPLQALTGLQLLLLEHTKMLTDLRPIGELTSLIEGIASLGFVSGLGRGGLDFRRGGLHFRNCAACALDTERLGRLADIEDDRERTERTLAYLRGLTVWPPVRADTPEQDDLLRVAPNDEGRLDVMPVRPGAVEAEASLKRTLYRRLRAAFADLERTTGNQQPEVSRRARAAQERCPEDFARADLVEVYLEIAWVRAEFDRRGERAGEDRFSNAAVAALDEILAVGPGIVLDNPDVEVLEDRRRRFADDPLPPKAADAQQALAETIAPRVDAFGDTLRDYAAGSLHPTPDPADRRGVVQRILTRNTVIAVGSFVCLAAVAGPIGNFSTDALRAAAAWAIDNQAPIRAAAAGWGEMFLAWLGPVFDQARAILAAGQAAGGVRPSPRLPKLP